MNAATATGTVPAIAIVDEQAGLVLRRPRPDDAQVLFEIAEDPDEIRFGRPAFVPRYDGLAAVHESIGRMLAEHAAGRPSTLVIATLDDPSAVLGTIGWRFDWGPGMGVADVGYSVHPAHRRRGLASAALRLLTRWLTHADPGAGQARVQLDHSVHNPASCRVATAAGFAREGVRRGFLPLRDGPEAHAPVRRHDVCLHGVLVTDLPPVRRVRAGVLLRDGSKLAVMRRVRAGHCYHVIIGGGVDAGEAVPAAAARELHEELGLGAKVGPDDLAASVWHDGGWQHYYAVGTATGRFGSGAGPEFSRRSAEESGSLPPDERGSYEPVWLDLADSAALAAADLRPPALVPLLR